MYKTRVVNIIAIFTNFITIAMEFFAFLIACSPKIFLSIFGRNPYGFTGYAEVASISNVDYFVYNVNSLRFFTVLTGIVTLLAAFLMIWANIVNAIKKEDLTPRLFFSLRYLATVMNALSLVIAVTFLYPTFTEVDALFAVDGGFLFLHFLCPIITFLQFIFLEIEPEAKFKKTFEPFVLITLYALVMIISAIAISMNDVNAGAHFVGPYYFFCFTPELINEWSVLNIQGEGLQLFVPIVSALGIFIFTYFTGMFIWAINRIFSIFFVGIEYHEKPVVEEKPATLKEFIISKVTFRKPNPAKYNHIYHISYHDRRIHTWKVKSVHAGRAIKVFPNQKEAIHFALDQVKKHGGSIRIHSMVGQIRKMSYWDRRRVNYKK